MTTNESLLRCALAVYGRQSGAHSVTVDWRQTDDGVSYAEITASDRDSAIVEQISTAPAEWDAALRLASQLLPADELVRRLNEEEGRPLADVLASLAD